MVERKWHADGADLHSQAWNEFGPFETIDEARKAMVERILYRQNGRGRLGVTFKVAWRNARACKLMGVNAEATETLKINYDPNHSHSVAIYRAG